MSLFNKTGLVAWYPMTEGSGTTLNDYAGSNNGTIVNGPTWQKEKDGGYSIKFDGSNDYVSIGAGLSTGLTNISVSMWINPSNVTRADWIGIFCEYYPGSGNVQWGIYLMSTGYLRTGFYNGAWKTVDTTTATTINVWTHIVTTYDGHYIRIYVNGVLSATSSDFNTSLPVDSNGWIIARRHDTAGTYNYYTGKIGETIIWNRALSANEIKALYEKTYIE
jgi:hypothetical protein